MSKFAKAARRVGIALLGAVAATGLGMASAQTTVPTSSVRIVSVGGALTEIVYALGAEKQLVAVDTTSMHPPAALQLPKVGYMRQLSAEGVLSMRPSVVLATTEAGPANVLAQLRDAKVNLEVVSADHSLAELRAKVRTVAKAVGREAEGQALDAKLAKAMEDAQLWVAKQPSTPRVLFILSHTGSPQVSGQGTAADAFIKLIGGVNVMTGFQGYKPLTVEGAVAAAPDVILTTTQGITAVGGVEKLLALPGLSLTPAAKDKRVVAMDALYLLGFGPRLPQAVREAAEQVRGG
jgi:iron complex transport system substrate-binding protein